MTSRKQNVVASNSGNSGLRLNMYIHNNRVLYLGYVSAVVVFCLLYVNKGQISVAKASFGRFWRQEIINCVMSLLAALKSVLGPRLYRMHQTNNSPVNNVLFVFSIIITSHWDDRCRPRRHLYPRNKCLSYEFIIYKIANILHYGTRCHGDLLCSHTIMATVTPDLFELYSWSYSDVLEWRRMICCITTRPLSAKWQSAVGLKSDGTTGHVEVDTARATVPSLSTCDGHTTGHWLMALFKRRDRRRDTFNCPSLSGS